MSHNFSHFFHQSNTTVGSGLFDIGLLLISFYDVFSIKILLTLSHDYSLLILSLESDAQ